MKLFILVVTGITTLLTGAYMVDTSYLEVTSYTLLWLGLFLTAVSPMLTLDL